MRKGLISKSVCRTCHYCWLHFTHIQRHCHSPLVFHY